MSSGIHSTTPHNNGERTSGGLLALPPGKQAEIHEMSSLINENRRLREQLNKSHEREDRLITELEEKDHVRTELEEELKAARSAPPLQKNGKTTPMLQVLAETPFISPAVFDEMPGLLQAGLALFHSKRECDVFLTGALAVLSGCLPGVWGRYDTATFAPNLYTFVIAPAGSGKSALTWARKLGKAVHTDLKRRSADEIQQWEYLQEQYQQARHSKTGSPPEPPGPRPLKRWLFIPGDVSSAAMVQALAAAEGRGIMFETEADTLSQTLEKDWGAYSDILRKAHPHEPITTLRREDSREIERPCLSVVLSGTPAQLPRLIPSIENGLWSRFVFYGFLPDTPTHWRNVQPRSYDREPDDLFATLAEQVLHLYTVLASRKQPLRFTLHDAQWKALNSACQDFKQRLILRFGHEATGTAHRTGLHIFRLAMTLTVWRAFESGTNLAAATSLEAYDPVFYAALTLGLIYGTHAETLMDTLPRTPQNGSLTQQQLQFYQELRPSFQTAEAMNIAAHIGLPDRTAKRYLSAWADQGLLRRLKQGHYQKP